MFPLIGEFQMALSNLMLRGVNRKHFHSENEDGIFMAGDNSRNTYFLLLFFGVMAVMPLNFIWALLDHATVNREFVFVFLFAHPIIGIIGLRKFLWLLRGKERIVVDGKHLVHERFGTFFTKRRTYELAYVKNLRNIKDIASYSWYKEHEVDEHFWKMMQNRKITTAMIWRLTIGQVGFAYKDQRPKLFNRLDDSQIDYVIREITRRLPEKDGAKPASYA